jgi:ketopantoate reductase
MPSNGSGARVLAVGRPVKYGALMASSILPGGTADAGGVQAGVPPGVPRGRNIAVIGAGAVGAVYARHLIRGGAHVTFVVRPKYVDDVKRGIRLWRGKHDEMLMAHEVVGDVAALRGQPIDQVWICVPSTGFDDAALDAIARATGDALIVDLSPGLDQRSLRIVGRERLVDGLIPFIAYQSPLPGVAAEAARAPGIAYWLPPLIGTSLSGPRARLAADALRAGGMRARVVPNAEVQRALGSAVLMSVIATLEVSGWSLAACRRRLDGATDEATRAMAKKHGVSRGPIALATSPAVLALGLRIAELIAPLPLQPYLRYHFTKVGAQTRMMMRGFLDAAATAGVDAPHLHALAAALPPRAE